MVESSYTACHDRRFDSARLRPKASCCFLVILSGRWLRTISSSIVKCYTKTKTKGVNIVHGVRHSRHNTGRYLIRMTALTTCHTYKKKLPFHLEFFSNPSTVLKVSKLTREYISYLILRFSPKGLTSNEISNEISKIYIVNFD